MFQLRILLLLLLIGVTAALRLVGLPWNLAPVGAICLFCGAYFRRKWLAVAVPLSAMLISDVGLGMIMHSYEKYTFHELMPLIYACFAIYVCLGFGIRQRWNALDSRSADGQEPDRGNPRNPVLQHWLPVGIATLAGSITFFVVTNFADYLQFYPHTWDELVKCYVVAIPFFRNTLLSDVAGVMVLFSGYELLSSRARVFEKTQLLHAPR